MTGYDPSVISTVLPTKIATDGSDVFRIEGKNFGRAGTAHVTIGGRPCRNILQGIGGTSPHENIQCNPLKVPGRGRRGCHRG